MIAGEGGGEGGTRNEHQKRDTCHSEKAQKCPPNVIALIITLTISAAEITDITITISLLLQNIIASLVTFPLMEKPLLWVQ